MIARIHSLDLFLPLRSVLLLDIYVPRWRSTIELSANHPLSFHPGLLLAMAYAVCLLRGQDSPELQSYVRSFERRAKEQLQKALSFCDRMEDWMYAQVIFTTCEIVLGKLTQVSRLFFYKSKLRRNNHRWFDFKRRSTRAEVS